MYCPNCGLNNPDNALNCSACGAALGAQAPGAAPPGYTLQACWQSFWEPWEFIIFIWGSQQKQLFSLWFRFWAQPLSALVLLQ